MSNGNQSSASVRILELDMSKAYEALGQGQKLPVVLKADAPRTGGLCAHVLDALATRLVDAMDMRSVYLPSVLTLFAREKKIVLDDSVDGRDVFVVLDFPLPDLRTMQPEFASLCNALATDAYVSLAQQAGDAAKKNGAESVHLIMPSYAYARQDKDHGERGPISAAIVLRNLEPYYDTITSVHLHSGAIKGMARDVVLNNISPNEIFTPRFVCRTADTFSPIKAQALTLDRVNALFDRLCIVSPDAGGMKTARDFAKYSKTFAEMLLHVDGKRIVDIPLAQIDKRRPGANEVEVMNVLGREHIEGRYAAIIDDMGDTFGTATKAAFALQEAGAIGVEFWGTHGYFSGNALAKIEQSPIERVRITNSNALPPEVLETSKVEVIDIAPILAQLIVDLSTSPRENLLVHHRHGMPPQMRKALGRYVSTMMPEL